MTTAVTVRTGFIGGWREEGGAWGDDVGLGCDVKGWIGCRTVSTGVQWALAGEKWAVVGVGKQGYEGGGWRGGAWEGLVMKPARPPARREQSRQK